MVPGDRLQHYGGPVYVIWGGQMENSIGCTSPTIAQYTNHAFGGSISFVTCLVQSGIGHLGFELQ
jgi:hypothetical protein